MNMLASAVTSCTPAVLGRGYRGASTSHAELMTTKGLQEILISDFCQLQLSGKVCH